MWERSRARGGSIASGIDAAQLGSRWSLWIVGVGTARARVGGLLRTTFTLLSPQSSACVWIVDLGANFTHSDEGAEISHRDQGEEI